jgi:hypothetical protein
VPDALADNHTPVIDEQYSNTAPQTCCDFSPNRNFQYRIARQIEMVHSVLQARTFVGQWYQLFTKRAEHKASRCVAMHDTANVAPSFEYSLV